MILYLQRKAWVLKFNDNFVSARKQQRLRKQKDQQQMSALELEDDIFEKPFGSDFQRWRQTKKEFCWCLARDCRLVWQDHAQIEKKTSFQLPITLAQTGAPWDIRGHGEKSHVVPLGHSSVVHLILFISSDSPVCNELVFRSCCRSRAIHWRGWNLHLGKAKAAG